MAYLSRKFAILLAAGKSTRTPGMLKQHALICRFPLFYSALKTMVECEEFKKIVIVVDRKNKRNVEAKIKKWKFKNVVVTSSWYTMRRIR